MNAIYSIHAGTGWLNLGTVHPDFIHLIILFILIQSMEPNSSLDHHRHGRHYYYCLIGCTLFHMRSGAVKDHRDARAYHHT